MCHFIILGREHRLLLLKLKRVVSRTGTILNKDLSRVYLMCFRAQKNHILVYVGVSCFDRHLKN